MDDLPIPSAQQEAKLLAAIAELDRLSKIVLALDARMNKIEMFVGKASEVAEKIGKSPVHARGLLASFFEGK